MVFLWFLKQLYDFTNNKSIFLINTAVLKDIFKHTKKKKDFWPKLNLVTGEETGSSNQL